MRNTTIITITLVAGALIAGCITLPQESGVSECGGFGGEAHFAITEEAGDDDDIALGYCDAEVLHWTYTESISELAIQNDRVMLNCCGNHSIEITEDGAGAYTITETDAPEGLDGARCGCMCNFDFALSSGEIPSGEIELTLVLNVTDDSSGPQTKWTGTIDLADVYGDIVVLESDEEGFCNEE